MTETERTGREARTESEAPTDKKDPDADGARSMYNPALAYLLLSEGSNRARALDAELLRHSGRVWLEGGSEA